MSESLKPTNIRRRRITGSKMRVVGHHVLVERIVPDRHPRGVLPRPDQASVGGRSSGEAAVCPASYRHMRPVGSRGVGAGRGCPGPLRARSPRDARGLGSRRGTSRAPIAHRQTPTAGKDRGCRQAGKRRAAARSSAGRTRGGQCCSAVMRRALCEPARRADPIVSWNGEGYHRCGASGGAAACRAISYARDACVTGRGRGYTTAANRHRPAEEKQS